MWIDLRSKCPDTLVLAGRRRLIEEWIPCSCGIRRGERLQWGTARSQSHKSSSRRGRSTLCSLGLTALCKVRSQSLDRSRTVWALVFHYSWEPCGLRSKLVDSSAVHIWSGRQIDLSCLSSGLKCRKCLCRLSSFLAKSIDPHSIHDSSHLYRLTWSEDSTRKPQMLIYKRCASLSPCQGKCSSEVVWTRKSNSRVFQESEEKQHRCSMFLSKLQSPRVCLWKISASSSLRIVRGSRRPS